MWRRHTRRHDRGFSRGGHAAPHCAAAKSCIFYRMISTALLFGILGTLAIAAKGTAARARMTTVEIRTTTKTITKKTIS
ncbi:hypothetical protein GRB31_04775 [Ralstonia solanacearum]|nr:hypothetical protein GRB31_04775 [Ralstonia solanacearum]